MRLLIIRHAIADDREEFAKSGRNDSERPLTKAGRRKMERAARGLRRVAPRIDVLASSPFVRAVQTAEIIAREYGGLAPVTIDELAPDGKYADFVRWLRALAGEEAVAASPAGGGSAEHPSAPAPAADEEHAERARVRVVAAVGHEPYLSELVSLLLTGQSTPIIELKKGAACLLELGDRPAAGRARLLWALTPGQLRRLGR